MPADYSSWAERSVSVNTLLLDPHNPRIPGGAALGQRDLIAQLVEHDKVYDLAKELADVGWFPLESLIGLQDGGQTFTLEGNRRLAALKLLHRPQLAPEGDVKKFRTLAGRASPPVRVRVLFAPTREAAAPILMQKHTAKQIEGWSAIMQAKFYRNLMEGGVSAEDVARRYGTTPGKVSEFLRLDAMYDAACAIELPAAVGERVRNPRDFPASTLERLLANSKFRDFLGVSIDRDGKFRVSGNKGDFTRAYGKVLDDITREKDRWDTRRLNNSADIQGYVDGLKTVAPRKGTGESFTLRDLQADSGPTPAPIPPPSPRTKRKGSGRSKSLIPKDMRCTIRNERILRIFGELKGLAVEQRPNSSAALLRILLEMGMSHYLDKTGRIEELTRRKPEDWYPTWKQMLQYILNENLVKLGINKRTVSGLAGDRWSPLDGFMHNRFEPADPAQLRSYAEALEPVLTMVLAEPEEAPAP